MTIPDQYYSGIVQFNVNESLPPEKIGTACGILYRDMSKMLGEITEVSWNLRLNIEIEQENGDKEMKHIISCVCKKVEQPLKQLESYVGDGDLSAMPSGDSCIAP